MKVKINVIQELVFAIMAAGMGVEVVVVWLWMCLSRALRGA